jgi:hypothetical protein
VNIRLLNDAEAREMFGDSEQWADAECETGKVIDHGVGNATPALLRTLTDLAEAVGDTPATLTVCRDWEGCLVGVLSPDDPGDWHKLWSAGLPDIYAFTETGRVGAGGINLPMYFDTVRDMMTYSPRRG